MPSSTDAGVHLDTNSTRDSFIPLFSGLHSEYREWRQRINIYMKKMKLQKREQEATLNLLAVWAARRGSWWKVSRWMNARRPVPPTRSSPSWTRPLNMTRECSFLKISIGTSSPCRGSQARHCCNTAHSMTSIWGSWKITRSHYLDQFKDGIYYVRLVWLGNKDNWSRHNVPILNVSRFKRLCSWSWAKTTKRRCLPTMTAEDTTATVEKEEDMQPRRMKIMVNQQNGNKMIGLKADTMKTPSSRMDTMRMRTTMTNPSSTKRWLSLTTTRSTTRELQSPMIRPLRPNCTTRPTRRTSMQEKGSMTLNSQEATSQS